jgi:hypothetical protein
MLKRQSNTLLMIAILAMVAAMSASMSAQTVKGKIEQMSGWQSCDACAGSGGSGPRASVTTGSGVSSPSIDGNSRVFNISSGTPYADGLWWKQLGAANGATNLVYDVYFYIKAPQYSQALEFDANQANGSKRWVFGTQCNIAAGVWDIWANAAGKWTSTGVPCSAPAAFKWHHLTWEFKRSGSYVTFVAFTYDGVRHYINRSYPAKASGVSELNVAFQMDMKANHVSYQTWLDNVSLKYW